MKLILKSVFSCVVGILLSVPSYGNVILPAGSLWEYSTDLGLTWSGPSPAPFGNYTSTGPDDYWDPSGDFNYRTWWPETGNMWVRTTIDLTSYDLNSIYYGLGVDNGCELYVNDQFVARYFAPLYTQRWEYVGQIPTASLNPTLNQLLVKLEDIGNLTAFDMQVLGGAVPDGGRTSLLLIAGLAACLAIRYRFAWV